MDLFHSTDSLPPAFKGAVIAIGNFDGVHRGHAALLDKVRGLARDRSVKAGVLTFEPHPRSLFRPDDPPFRITPAPLKLRRLEAVDLDFICALPFDWDFASQSAETFIDKILRRGLAPAHIVVGEDFRFGQLRRGTTAMLAEAGFGLTVMPPVTAPDGAAFSSSLIRENLRKGDIGAANAMLGYEWEIEGIVSHGNKRGRELGFPTANVPLNDTLHPGYGVYATVVRIEGEDQWRPAATNIGIRPMFELKVGQVEAHILDFNQNIYGKILHIRPLKQLRGEAKFDSLDALIRQINEDCAQVRALLA